MKEKLMKEIINKIEEFETIAIFRHVFPDPDSYSSQTALKSIINNTYPDKKVVILGEHSKNLEYINTMDEEIDLDKECLAIIVDVANAPRVDNQSFNKCGYIIKIDHHKPFDAPFENLTWVDTNYSSCSEMILDLYLANEDKLKIDKKGRRALFTGIVGDTGRFLYIDNPTNLFDKLSKITFDLETKEIYANMYKREEAELKFLGYIYSNYVTTENGMAYLKIPNEIVKKYNLQAIKAARMVNALQDTVGIINWHFFAEKEDGSIFCEFRSNGPRVNDIAANFGGGGHMLAAGASLENWERVDEILKVLDENCKNFLKKAE